MGWMLNKQNADTA